MCKSLDYMKEHYCLWGSWMMMKALTEKSSAESKSCFHGW